VSEKRIGIVMHGRKGRCAGLAPLCAARPATPCIGLDEALS